jgi:hypothetical protein
MIHRHFYFLLFAFRFTAETLRAGQFAGAFPPGPQSTFETVVSSIHGRRELRVRAGRFLYYATFAAGSASARPLHLPDGTRWNASRPAVSSHRPAWPPRPATTVSEPSPGLAGCPGLRDGPERGWGGPGATVGCMVSGPRCHSLVQGAAGRRRVGRRALCSFLREQVPFLTHAWLPGSNPHTCSSNRNARRRWRG